MSFLELLEAEGRVAKKNAETLTRRFLFIYFGAAFLFCAALVATAALYMWMCEYLSKPLSLLIVAALLLAMGISLFCKCRSESDAAVVTLPAKVSSGDETDER